MRAIGCSLFLLFLTLQTGYAKAKRFRIMWRDNPSTSMVIGWDQVSGANPKVFFDTKDHGGRVDLFRFAQKPDRVEPAKTMNNHFVRLTGLQPNTVYYFIIADTEGSSRQYSFRTAPNTPNTPISLIAGGDSRNFRKARQRANTLVAKLRPTAVLFAGDMTGGDTGPEWVDWLDDWQETISPDGRLYPILAARGNHEFSNSSISQIFDTSNPDIYYAMTIGGNLLRIYTLNSLIASGGHQRDWLEKDLQDNQQVLWRMAQYHHAMRPHTKRKGEKDELVIHWAGLFFQYAVQLVLESDSHVVKWTYPIRPSTQGLQEEGFIRNDENGTVYIGEGCWGAPLRENDDDKTWTRNSGSFNQFKWIFISSERIQIRTVEVDKSTNASALTDDNRFQIPPGLGIWNPSRGSCVEIFQPAPATSAQPDSVEPTSPDELAEENRKNWIRLPGLKPDPQSNTWRVEFKLLNPADINIQAYNLFKKEVLRTTLGELQPGTYQKPMDFNTLPKGIYLVVVRANGKGIQYFHLSL